MDQLEDVDSPFLHSFYKPQLSRTSLAASEGSADIVKRSPPSLPSDFRLPHAEEIELGSASTTSLNPLLSRAESTTQKISIRPKRFWSGWRIGASASAWMTTAVLLTNVIATKVFISKYGYENGIVTMVTGNCSRVKRLSTWVHLLINTVSTILLACSNYCMQAISASTTDEVVQAHKDRYYLRIGVQSVRNLPCIRKNRRIIWYLLFFSSVPLHLLYNSVVFSTLQTNDYDVLPVTPDFLDGEPWSTLNLMGVPTDIKAQIVSDASVMRDRMQNDVTTIKLSGQDCLSEYNKQYLSAYGDLFLVQENNATWRYPVLWAPKWLNDSAYVWTSPQEASYYELGYNSSGRAYAKIGKFYRLPLNDKDTLPFNSTSDVFRLMAGNSTSISSWAPYGSTIDFCVAEIVPEVCKLQFSLDIAVWVILCNVTKLGCMLYVVFGCREARLVTLGDAIAAFLDNPDPHTKDRCLDDLERINKEWHGMTRIIQTRPPPPKPIAYQPRAYLWARASSKHRFIILYTLFLMSIILAGVIIKATLTSIGMPSSLKELWETGIGVLSNKNILSVQLSPLGGALLANLPQVVLSYIYVFFNGALTSMLAGEEWTHYYMNKKPLRVSFPTGGQRSTYWLQVPYRYSIPLTIVSGLLHWLSSESLFLVLIDHLDNSVPRQIDPDRHTSTLGFSPVAIILATIVSVVYITFGTALALRRFPKGMPIAGSCSALISAACHPPLEDASASIRPVQWGALKTDMAVDEDEEADEVGHCTFTSFDVDAPREGRLYL